MNQQELELEEAQRIGKHYAASQISVEDIAVMAQGKVKQAAKKDNAKPTTKKPPYKKHTAADMLAAAKKERDEKQWLFCGNDMELEVALEKAVVKEKRLNIATRNAMAPPPKPRKPRRTPLQMAEARRDEILTKLTAATDRRDSTSAHINKITQERPHAAAERKGVIDAALDILRGELITLTSKVSNMKDDLRMAENHLAAIHIPRGNPVEEYEDAKQLYEAGKIGSAKLADYREAARVAIMRGMQ
jgi:hypothetical protein